MAEVLDSPMSNRSVLSFGALNTKSDGLPLFGGCSPNSCGSSAVQAEHDTFEFQSSNDDGDANNKRKRSRSSQEQSFREQQQVDEQEIKNILMDEQTSQQSFLSQNSAFPRSQQSEILTQNADYTQMTMTQDDHLSMSPFPPSSPVNPLSVPWGRLMPCYGDKALHLLPRAPESDQTVSTTNECSERAGGTADEFSLLGLEHLRPSDVFNVYNLGRNQQKCDLVAQKAHKPEANTTKQGRKRLQKENNLHDWAFGMISNRHCRVYCTLPEDAKKVCLTGTKTIPASAMEVYVEDSSNNGTMINQSILLQRGQKRRLHSGDEISLVNLATLRKRIRDPSMLQTIHQKYSFVFVNVAHQQQQLKLQQSPNPQRGLQPAGPSINTMFPLSLSNSNPSSLSTKPRRGMVNVRAMNYPYNNGQAKMGAYQSPALSSPSPSHELHPNKGSNHQHRSAHMESNRELRRVSSSVTKPPLRPEQASPARRIEEDYDIRDLLGRGTCGEVRRAIHRLSGKERAVKIISLPSPGLLNNKHEAEAEQWQAEARILQSLEHPYIVQLADVFRTGTHLYLVMELCSGGDLFDRIIQTSKYSEIDSRRVMRRLLSAIHYIHEDCELVHRDLKPENILLTGVNDPCDIKITDFGVAKSASCDLKTFCGTPLYFAPEVLRRRHTVLGQGRYGKPADMWSLGVVLYILLSGTPPYDIDGASGMDVILQSSAKIPFPASEWSSISAEAIDLVKRMLIKDPRKRITVREACEHAWILTEDGDSHRHPLEDPKLISVTKRRLFPAGPPVPAPVPVSTLASPRSSPPKKKRRKISMEGGAIVAMNEEGRARAMDAEQKEDNPLLEPRSGVNNKMSPLSAVEKKDPAFDDVASASGAISPITETSGADGMNTKHEKGGRKSPPSALFGALNIKTTKEIVTSKVAVSKKPARDSCTAKNDNLVAESSNTLALGPAMGIDTNNELQLSFGSGSQPQKQLPENKQSESDEQGAKSASDRGTGKKPRSRAKKVIDTGLVKAAELEDDRICSQFSDEEEAESISSFGNAVALDVGADIARNEEENGKKLKQTLLAPLPASSSQSNSTDATASGKATKTKNTATKPKAAKKGNTASKNAQSAAAKDPKQQTLSAWFKPAKKKIF